MQSLSDSIERLVAKVELLAKAMRALRNDNSIIKEENKKLHQLVNQYKAENQRLKSSQSEDTIDETSKGNKEENGTGATREQIEQYIGDINYCLEQLKEL